MQRRTFLKLGAATGVAAPLAYRGLWNPAGAEELGAFRHGVASGDPLPGGVIIWTRVTPTPEATPGSGLGPTVDVAWEVATDGSFATIVQQGTFSTGPARDHTVKVDVAGLIPATTYAYRFRLAGETSPLGRTKTAPAADADPARLRFGAVSCSNWTGGFFSAYRHMASRNDLDFVIHLGDYLYEYGNGQDRYGPTSLTGIRDHVPAVEMVTLSDYRQRHAQYKTDPDLQLAHRRYAWIVTLDDHEITNDAYDTGAENHDPVDDPTTTAVDPEGDFASRRGRAYQAYFEYMPLRPPDPADPTRIYRRLAFGRLADLHMLDLRQYRSRQLASATDPANDSPLRTIMGDAQIGFLTSGLRGSTHRWRLIGNSVQFPPLRSPAPPFSPFNTDAWNGYTADRNELLDVIVGGPGPADDIANVVFLTGDIHSSWAIEIPRDPAGYPATSPSLAAEYVVTSVTSDNLNEITRTAPARSSIPTEQAFIARNPFVKLLNFDDHGYSVVEVTPQRFQMDWYYIRTANPATDPRTDPNATQVFGQAFQTPAGTNQVVPAATPLVDDGGAGPDPVIPELSVAALLPATAVAVLGTAVLLRRRRERPPTPPAVEA